METKVICPKCGHEFNVKETVEIVRLLSENKEFLTQALKSYQLNSEAEKELQKILDLINRIEAL